ncbi:eye-specific diacylglycerol kinase isoform X1 [Tetranychus urticae]|uniref:eye-specific diacylglycerol kinase isoform X1 n=1 Tax=Tetranychus urticae TaxID=32264 RepID=UPI00077B8C4C|nr:eye-specific diacylglycerol kinase isoform X1 [Tetranychus urticae]
MQRLRDKFRRKNVSTPRVDRSPSGNIATPATSSGASSHYLNNVLTLDSTSESYHSLMVPDSCASTSNDKIDSCGANSFTNSNNLSLPVGVRQIRSASYDEIRIRRDIDSIRLDELGSTTLSTEADPSSLTTEPEVLSSGSEMLDVPLAAKSARSKSFDSASGKEAMSGKLRSGSSISFLEIPKWKLFIRRSSSPSSGRASPFLFFGEKCIHCSLVEEQAALKALQQTFVSSTGSLTTEDDDTDDEVVATCSTRRSFRPRRRSTSDDLNEGEHDHATFSGPFDKNLAKNILSKCGSSSEPSSPRDEEETKSDSELISKATGTDSDIVTHVKTARVASDSDAQCLISGDDISPMVTLSAAPPPEAPSPLQEFEEDLGNGITVISLEVPLTKQNRSASIDASFLKVPENLGSRPKETSPTKTQRSHSVDISLPTKPDGPYLIVQSSRPEQIFLKKAIQGEIKISTENGETRTLRSAPDWGETAINGDHLWVSTSTSGDLCYVGENECSKQGPRLCCPACKITAHTGCIGILIDKIKFHCKPTFKDVGVRQYREQTVIHHHWVHRRSQKGRCRQCGKSFQSKLSFANKEIVAISCSWCKTAYHNKENCFTLERLTETCSLGIHKDLIIPHSWIVKLPRKGSFKSSIRRSPKNKRSSSKRRTKKEDASPIVAVSSENSHHLPVHPLSSSSSSCSPQPPPIHPTVGLTSTSTMPPQSSSAPQPLTPLSANQLPSCSFSSSAVLSQSQPNNSNPMDISSSSSLATSSTITATSSTAISSLGAGPQPNVPTPPPPGAVPTEPRPSLCAPGQHRSFAIKPIPSPDSKPLLVFINPKSGGNQGSKLMQKFQWLLNPRQVFDLSQGGPRPGLELYRKVPNLRILACGGDGTAGWILSVLDEIGFKPSPPIAVLPLGTGNDLARALGWGGGYTDEPVSKILLNIKDGEVVQLDRWDVKVTRNTDLNLIEQAADTPEGAKESLPLNVINNYFSIGVDAHIALEFHEAREAHPERFNSRLRNKMFYGQAGGKDLLQRKWKDLVTYITVECDGVDLTQRLRDLKVHSLLFLNIPCYGGGTRPWGSASPSFELPRTDDGLIEVIGLTTYQLPLLQAGGHGSCVAQCKEAKIITRRTIPMQVDGEPCRLLPSIIRIKVKNQANMVAKSKTHCQIASMPTLDREIVIPVRKLNILDYETFHYDKSRLHDASIVLGKLQINPDLELNHVRALIRQMVANHRKGSTSIHMLNKEPGDEMARYRLEKAFDISNDWCFVDSCTAERYFRIDRAQEHLHYVVDICNDELYILDPTDNGYDRDKLAKASNVPTTQLADNSPASGLSGDETPSPVDPALYGDNNNTIVLFKPPTTKEPGSGKDDSGDTLNVNTASQLLEGSSIPGTPTTATETLTETATESNNPSASKETVMSDKEFACYQATFNERETTV